MYKLFILLILLGLLWCTVGLFTPLYIVIRYGRQIPPTCDAYESDDKNLTMRDNIYCVLTIVLLWPLLLKYSRAESVGRFNTEKWLM